MPRAIPTGRFQSLIEAAIRVFSQKGFRRTQMVDIADEMGVSAGTLYNYVESKEALFYLVVDRGFGEERDEVPVFPVRTPPPGAIARRVAERVKTLGAQPRLGAALKRKASEDPVGELNGVLRDLYQTIYRVADATTMIDRSALDMPELAALWYDEVRGGLLSRLARLIELRAQAGQYRRVPHTAAAARLMLETIVWFARNRRNDPRSEELTDAVAEQATIDFLLSGLIAQPPERKQ